jgi:restriction endonuclease S subunit
MTFVKFDGTPYINGTHTFALVNECDATLKCLFYYLRDDMSIKKLRQFLTGVTVFQMSIKSLSAFKVELPPLSTQARIADIYLCGKLFICNFPIIVHLIQSPIRP